MVACKHYGRILQPGIFHINTGFRIFIEKTSRIQEKIHWDVCSTDMDKYADTHCFGRNTWPISFTSEEYTVTPFLEKYSEQVNIPICTGATLYTMESGEVIILIFGQGLWFGNRMDKTLINPNQYQHFGIPICDNHTDQHKPLGIEADFNTHISMPMVRSTCGFINRYPTNDEIEICQHITISNEHDWYPQKNIFKISSMEEDQRRNMFNLRMINQVRSQTPCYQPVTYIQYEMDIHDFDIEMANVSIELAHDLMVDRLIGNIIFSMTKKGHATITNERHHLITPELLVMKWGIGLEKVK